jgi:hypothetical protein
MLSFCIAIASSKLNIGCHLCRYVGGWETEACRLDLTAKFRLVRILKIIGSFCTEKYDELMFQPDNKHPCPHPSIRSWQFCSTPPWIRNFELWFVWIYEYMSTFLCELETELKLVDYVWRETAVSCVPIRALGLSITESKTDLHMFFYPEQSTDQHLESQKSKYPTKIHWIKVRQHFGEQLQNKILLSFIPFVAEYKQGVLKSNVLRTFVAEYKQLTKI